MDTGSVECKREHDYDVAAHARLEILCIVDLPNGYQTCKDTDRVWVKLYIHGDGYG